jgi:hypothetical protein
VRDLPKLIVTLLTTENIVRSKGQVRPDWRRLHATCKTRRLYEMMTRKYNVIVAVSNTPRLYCINTNFSYLIVADEATEDPIISKRIELVVAEMKKFCPTIFTNFISGCLHFSYSHVP